MEFEDLTVHQAKSKVNHLYNLREMKLKQKEANFMKTQPKSPALDKLPVEGGTRSDKFAEFIITDEKLDQEIEHIDNLIELYEEFIKKELKRLDEYDEWEQKVIYMREQNHLTYFQIALKTPFSERTVRRIWKHYSGKRK